MICNLEIGPVIRSALGETVVANLRVMLQPIDCQTCGARFTDSDELVMAVDSSFARVAFAALHHKGCRLSDWRATPGAMVHRHLTWRNTGSLSDQLFVDLVVCGGRGRSGFERVQLDAVGDFLGGGAVWGSAGVAVGPAALAGPGCGAAGPGGVEVVGAGQPDADVDEDDRELLRGERAARVAQSRTASIALVKLIRPGSSSAGVA
jgi:hypothetical protein